MCRVDNFIFVSQFVICHENFQPVVEGSNLKIIGKANYLTT